MSKIIPLTQGRAAIVDDRDYDRVSKFKWYAHFIDAHWYASRNTPRDAPGPRIERMHRSIISVPAGLVADHRNGDGLDNRRANLRIATRQQNGWNHAKSQRGSSRFIGVSREGAGWRAKISCGRRGIQIGYFAQEIDAAIAYDAKCRELRGEFARLNFRLVVRRSRLCQILTGTRGQFFSACFMKRTDGLERVIRCRTGVHPSDAPSVLRIIEYHDLLTVWDIEKREFRCIPIEGILWIRLKGMFIRPARRASCPLDVSTQGLLFARTAG